MNAACLKAKTCQVAGWRYRASILAPALRHGCARTSSETIAVRRQDSFTSSSPSLAPGKQAAEQLGALVASTSLLVLGPSQAAQAASEGLFDSNLPLPLELFLLVAVNIGAVWAVLNVVRNLGDNSEPLTVVKIQVGLLENHPHLQSKLGELNSMIQVGQVGTWLILEEAILELLKHQSHIAYADVKVQDTVSKKRAYGMFGQLAEEETRKADAEQHVALAHSTVSVEDEDSCSPAGGLWGMLGGQDCGVKKATEATVVTLVVAARGRLDISPSVTSWPELRHTLQQLTGLTSDKVMGVELLWTPTQDNEYLTRQQLRADYPNLLPLQRESA